AGRLWRELSRAVSARRLFRRQDPQRRQAGRSAGRTGDQVRDHRQSQDRERAGHQVTNVDSAARRPGDRMNRREFITYSACSVFAPLAARAQPALPVVGFLNPTSSKLYAFNAEAFRQGLQDAGFVEGRNVHIEYRWGEFDYSRLPALAAELVARQVAV